MIMMYKLMDMMKPQVQMTHIHLMTLGWIVSADSSAIAKAAAINDSAHLTGVTATR